MAKDIYHYLVKEALEKDGWKITQDPLLLTDKSMKIDYEIDLGAERLLAAEKENEKIAVEVKSFLKTSLVNEFHSILGQYLVYQEGLLRLESDRLLYLAIPHFAEIRLEEYKFLQELINLYHLKIIVFDEKEPIILKWKN